MGKQNNECGYSNNLFIYHRFIIYKGQYPVVDVFVVPKATYIYLRCPPYQCGVLSIMGGDVANPDPGTNVLLISVNNIYLTIYNPRSSSLIITAYWFHWYSHMDPNGFYSTKISKIWLVFIQYNTILSRKAIYLLTNNTPSLSRDLPIPGYTHIPHYKFFSNHTIIYSEMR